MSNFVPPTTPIGGPQGFPPQQPFPPPAPQKKSNVLMWVVVGCGSFVILGIIVVALGGFFIWNKAKEAGLDPELMQKQPALAVAKMAAALNKDIEIVSVDESNGIITFKDKNTGKTVTMTVDQAKGGAITFEEEGGKGKVSIQAGADGEKGALEIKTDEGTAKIGTESANNLPAWIPSYPGSQPAGLYSAQTKDGDSGGFQFVTKDPPDKVINYYSDSLKNSGLTVNTNILQQNGKITGGTASGEGAGKKQTILVTAMSDPEGTRVSVIFEFKK